MKNFLFLFIFFSICIAVHWAARRHGQLAASNLRQLEHLFPVAGARDGANGLNGFFHRLVVGRVLDRLGSSFLLFPRF